MKTLIVRRVFGRMPEEVAKLSDEQKQCAAIKNGLRIGDDDTLKVFKTRQAMARLIRKQEKNAPQSEWHPIVKLTDGEGY
jgi:hypothetical protein